MLKRDSLSQHVLQTKPCLRNNQIPENAGKVGGLQKEGLNRCRHFCDHFQEQSAPSPDLGPEPRPLFGGPLVGRWELKRTSRAWRARMFFSETPVRGGGGPKRVNIWICLKWENLGLTMANLLDVFEWAANRKPVTWTGPQL